MPLLMLIFACLNVKADPTTYVHYTKIHPGQMRYSSANVERKKLDAIKQKRAIRCKNNRFEFKYNNCCSILAPKDALPVIKAPFGLVLADGHHDVLTSIALGANTIPITVVKDLSHLSKEEFWKESNKLGYTYPYAIGGTWKIPPRSFKKLIDDTNRYFATITSRKCKKEGQEAKETKGAEYPLWIKIGKEMFPEFRIADIMYKNNLKYEYSMGHNPPEQLVEKTRDALNKANLKDITIVQKRTKFDQITDICKSTS